MACRHIPDLSFHAAGCRAGHAITLSHASSQVPHASCQFYLLCRQLQVSCGKAAGRTAQQRCSTGCLAARCRWLCMGWSGRPAQAGAYSNLPPEWRPPPRMAPYRVSRLTGSGARTPFSLLAAMSAPVMHSWQACLVGKLGICDHMIPTVGSATTAPHTYVGGSLEST